MDSLTKFEIMRRIDGARIVADFKEVNELKLDQVSTEEEAWNKILKYRRLLNQRSSFFSEEVEEAEMDYYPLFFSEKKAVIYQSKRMSMLIGFSTDEDKVELVIQPNSEYASEWLWFWASIFLIYKEEIVKLDVLDRMKDRMIELMAQKMATQPLGDGDNSLSLSEAKQISALLGDEYPAMQQWQKEVEGKYLN